MKKRFVFSNKWFYLLIAFGILAIISGVSIAVGMTRGGHSANNLLITKDGHRMTLQEAMSGNVFIYGASADGITTVPDPGHDEGEIWVSVNGEEMTLQAALSTEEGLCGMSSPSSSYTSPDIPNPSHLATEIEISPGTSLQDAINSEDFCCEPKTCASLGYICGTWSNGCGGTITCGDCSGGLCKGGTCCSRHEVRCSDNDEYWYDSCGNREGKSKDCGDTSCWDSLPRCYFPYDNWREYTLICHLRGCSNGECYLSSSEDFKREKCSGGRKCVDGDCIYPDTGGGGGGTCPYIYACSGEECKYVHDAFSHSFMKSLEDYSYQTYKSNLDYVKITEPFEDETSYITDFKIYGINSDNLFLPEDDTGVLHSITNPIQPYKTEGNSYYFRKKGDYAKIIINARHTDLPIRAVKYLWSNLGANWFEFYDNRFSLPILNKIWRDYINQVEMRVLVNGKDVGRSVRVKWDVIDNQKEYVLVYVPVKEDELNITLNYVEGWYVPSSVTIDFSEDVEYSIKEIETDFSPFSISTNEEKIIHLEENSYDNYLFEIKGWYKPYWALKQNQTFKQSLNHFVSEVLPSITSGNPLSYIERNSEAIENLQ